MILRTLPQDEVAVLVTGFPPSSSSLKPHVLQEREREGGGAKE